MHNKFLFLGAVATCLCVLVEDMGSEVRIGDPNSVSTGRGDSEVRGLSEMSIISVEVDMNNRNRNL